MRGSDAVATRQDKQGFYIKLNGALHFNFYIMK